jgi:hypothetical protein
MDVDKFIYFLERASEESHIYTIYINLLYGFANPIPKSFVRKLEKSKLHHSIYVESIVMHKHQIIKFIATNRTVLYEPVRAFTTKHKLPQIKLIKQPPIFSKLITL